jgi:hypothetical protein
VGFHEQLQQLKIFYLFCFCKKSQKQNGLPYGQGTSTELNCFFFNNRTISNLLSVNKYFYKLFCSFFPFTNFFFSFLSAIELKLFSEEFLSTVKYQKRAKNISCGIKNEKCDLLYNYTKTLGIDV